MKVPLAGGTGTFPPLMSPMDVKVLVNDPKRQRARRCGGALASIVLLAVGAGSARAAEYTVYGGSAEHPSVSAFKALSDGSVKASSGGLFPPRLQTYGSADASASLGQQATWTLNAPEGTTISGFSMKLSCDSNDGWQTGLFSEFEGSDFGHYEDFAPVVTGGAEKVMCNDGDVVSEAAIHSADYFPELESSGLQLRSRCAADPPCTGSGSGGPGSATASDFAVTIDDPDSPTIQSVDGPLFTGGQLWGRVSTSFTAVDFGSGIARATLTIDGNEVGSTKGSCSVETVPPCPMNLQTSIVTGSSGLSIGVDHKAVLTVEDYAGNTARTSSVFVLTSGSTLSSIPPGLLESILAFQHRAPTITMGKVRTPVSAGDRILLSGTVQQGGAIAYDGGRVHLQLSRNSGRTWTALRTARVRTDETFRAHVRLKTRAKRLWFSAALASARDAPVMVVRSNVVGVRVRKKGRRTGRGRRASAHGRAPAHLVSRG